jgi:hypothetical protein
VSLTGACVRAFIKSVEPVKWYTGLRSFQCIEKRVDEDHSLNPPVVQGRGGVKLPPGRSFRCCVVTDMNLGNALVTLSVYELSTNLRNGEKILLKLRPPIQYGGGNTEVCLKFHLKFGIHGILRQNLTNHQILLRISIVSTNRHSQQHIVVDREFFCDKKCNMAAAKPEVASNLQINSIAEKFSRISPIL